MNTRRQVSTVLYAVRPIKGDTWLTPYGTWVADWERARTFTTFDRAERFIELQKEALCPGGLKVYKVWRMPYALPSLNPDLMSGDDTLPPAA